MPKHRGCAIMLDGCMQPVFGQEGLRRTMRNKGDSPEALPAQSALNHRYIDWLEGDQLF